MEVPAAATPSSSLHPVLWIAGISVTLLSLAGIASLTGLLPARPRAGTAGSRCHATRDRVGCGSHNAGSGDRAAGTGASRQQGPRNAGDPSQDGEKKDRTGPSLESGTYAAAPCQRRAT